MDFPVSLIDSPVRKGEITEIVGALSSGRSSLSMACLRDVTRAGAVAALVDADETFDPASAERAGVDLERVLWVRCGRSTRTALRAADLLVRCPGFAVVVLDMGQARRELPLTRAFRLKVAARQSGVALLIVGLRRSAGSAASLVVEAHQHGVEWSGPGPVATRLSRLCTELHVVRARGVVRMQEHAAVRWWVA